MKGRNDGKKWLEGIGWRGRDVGKRVVEGKKGKKVMGLTFRDMDLEERE